MALASAEEENVLSAHKRLSPVYTGWDLIRMGGLHDGSYLVPNCLEGISGCYSPGVCEVVSFEEDLYNVFGIRSYTCDPEEQQLRKSQLAKDGIIDFSRFALASETGPGHKTMQEWLTATGNDSPAPGTLLISMDIEGAEYAILPSWSLELLDAFRIITIEIHHLHLLWNNAFLPVYNRVIDALTVKHDIVHAHFNNGTLYTKHQKLGDLYTCVELTLLNKRYRRCHPEPIPVLPNELDIINVPSKPEAVQSILVNK